MSQSVDHNTTTTTTSGDTEVTLGSTSRIYNEINDVLRCGTPVTPEMLKSWSKLASKANRSAARFVRYSWQENDRLTIEIELLKQEMAKETLDKEANVRHPPCPDCRVSNESVCMYVSQMARTFEKLRSYASIGPSDVDRAIGGAAHVERMMNTLASNEITLPSKGTVFLGRDYAANGDGLARLVNR
tara:strand:- start:178 stop:738 length:561 start_codon:yes stop_codon:yes gene_type:complete